MHDKNIKPTYNIKNENIYISVMDIITFLPKQYILVYVKGIPYIGFSP